MNWFAANDGQFNAYTTWVATNYHFHIKNEAFDDAMDRFSNSFINPTFPEQRASKAIKTIHHQFKSSLCSNFWHHTNLWLSLSHSKSPIHGFRLGNKNTLSQPDARQAMIDFHKTYYSPSIMTLCVYSNKTIEELESKVN